MGSLKTLAVIYETRENSLFKSALDQLMFSTHCFIPIGIDPKQESTFSIKDSETARLLFQKLDAADELYIINPKGSISPFLSYFLGYAEENGKAVRYMYKFCYTDCKFRVAKRGKVCGLSNDIYFIPDSHKLLPACESYSRIYDNWLVKETGGKVSMLPLGEAPASEEAHAEPDPALEAPEEEKETSPA